MPKVDGKDLSPNSCSERPMLKIRSPTPQNNIVEGRCCNINFLGLKFSQNYARLEFGMHLDFQKSLGKSFIILAIFTLSMVFLTFYQSTF
jgi:hypothetical protein